MVANRDVLRAAKEDENTKLEAQRAAHDAELRNGFFEVLAESLMAKAPLLLNGLRARHKQSAPFDKYFDGKPAWDELERLCSRFSITRDGGGLTYMIGMVLISMLKKRAATLTWMKPLLA